MAQTIRQISLEQSLRWLDKFNQNRTGEHWDNMRQKIHCFVSFCQTISIEPCMSIEYDALIKSAMSDAVFNEVMGAFKGINQGDELDDKYRIKNRVFLSSYVDLERCALLLVKFEVDTTHLLDVLYRESGASIDRALSLRHQLDSLLSSSTMFNAPYAEALLLYVYGTFFAQKDRVGISSGNPNHHPYNFDILYSSAEAVYNYLYYTLQSQSSRHAALIRFKVYSEWYGRQELLMIIQSIADDYYDEYVKWKAGETKEKPRYYFEKPLHTYMNKFFFQMGYFPLVNFRMGGDEPDTLAVPDDSRSLAAGNPIVIEVKQLVNDKINNITEEEKIPGEVYIKKSIDQLLSYLKRIETSEGLGVKEGALVLFYNSDERKAGVIPEVIRLDDYLIYVVLVYLGETTASACSDPIRLQY